MRRSTPYLILLVAGMAMPTTGLAQAAEPSHASAPHCAIRRCTPEELLLDRLAHQGLPVAIAALDSIATVDPEVRRLGHNYAHALGLAAYTTPEEVGEVFSQCTAIFQSGCYHGVIQSYFEEHARVHGDHLDAAMVNALCNEQRADSTQQWILFQCVHGLGHGLMMVYDNHLPTSLGGCDLLTSPWEREVCYGAVFMENVVLATTPHHAFGRPEEGADDAHAHGGDEHAGHTMPPSTVTRPDFPGLDRDRPLYPCNALPDRYAQSCYQMQTSAILHFNGRDIAGAGRECMKAPDVFRSTCIQSLGRDVSALTVQNHPRALQMCSAVPQGYEQYCHLGYAKNLVDQTSDPQDGFEFCGLLTSAESKSACYIGIGEQLWVLYTDSSRRAQVCQSVEAGYVSACLRGAGLGGSDVRAQALRSEPVRLE